VTDPRTRIVAEGYDAMGEHFAEWRDRIVGDSRRWWAEQLTSQLTDGARVLELGCGSGVPDTQLLAERFRVTAVDISAEQIRRAQENVPNAEFLVADFAAADFDPGRFDAVVAFYSFNHVPRELLAGLFARIRSWLVTDGLFLVALGTGDDEGWVGEWLGVTMFFSSFTPDTNSRLLDEAGFERLLDEVGTFLEPDGEATFQWVLARA
jgi:cyclopropane fatty-acyl-phospholipid synthase-like methyltransferase